MAMATHAANSAFPRRDLRPLCHRFRPSNCLFSDRVRARDAEAAKLDNMRLILSSPPKNPKPYLSRFHAPPGCDPTDITSISETKCTSSPYKLINGVQRWTADVSPNLDIFIVYPDEEYQQYFSVHSAEDGNISPARYYLRPPFRDFVFTGNSYNGLLHFQNAEWENLVWNPTTNEFKIFPKTFDPPSVESVYFDSGMWFDRGYEYKVMQVVMAGVADNEGDDFHIQFYSSKSNSWKKIQCSEFGSMDLGGDCINGGFYSSATRKGDESGAQILSFDFSSETLSTMPFPGDTSSRYKYYLEYKGLLGYLACWPTNGRPWKFELWVMENDRSWTRESVFHTCGVWDPLWFSQNGELLYFASFDSEVVVFNRATGELKHLGIYFFEGDEKQLIPVVKSFVPLADLWASMRVRVRDAEAVKLDNMRLILDSPPKNPRPYSSTFYAPAGCDPTDVTSVFATKCTSSPYKLINGVHRSTADISPDLEIFIVYTDQDYKQYFSIYSAEDGNISPAKYYLCPPFRDFFFTGNCSNGLLHFQNGEWENLVWNPTTNEFKIFPKTFDPPRIENMYFDSGMWCDRGYGYKVMQVVMAGEADDDGDDFHIELYSSNTNSWKKIQCSEFGFMNFSGDCINGAFYCSATPKGDESRAQILSFDFSSETLSTIPFPNDTKGARYKYFLDYKGLLGYLACWPTNGRPWKFELWVMEKDRSWTRESVFHTCGVWDPLWFSQNGELLYFVSFDSEAVVFNRATGELKHLGISFFPRDRKQLIPVIKSFVPLDRLVDVDEVQVKEDINRPFEAMDGGLLQA